MKWDLFQLEQQLLVGSTLVEGSTLSEAEARQVLAGRTVSGHPIHEIRELANYRAAVAWLAAQLETVPYLSEDLILQSHRLLLEGLSDCGGQYKLLANFTFKVDGSKHHFLKPALVRQAMRAWLGKFNGADLSSPEEGAADLYYDFIDIHPFEDGNGRIARVLIAYWLHWKWRRSFSFYLRDKREHLDALEAANLGDLGPLRRFFADRLRELP